MLVIDASIAAAWLYEDESEPVAENAISSLANDDGVVPLLWRYEVRNLLLMGVRRGRIDQEAMRERLGAIESLPLMIDDQSNLTTALDLAEKHRLSFYDALYLELAKRLGAPIATLDKALIRAAQNEAITVFGADPE